MSCNILYIEDDVSLALTISYILGQAGHNVTVAHTAAEGIQLFRSIRPQFLLLDVQLPDMSGHRIAEMLQRNNELANCFLIFISGRGVETEIIKSLTCYADEFLLKPLDPRILIAKIQALHRRKNISYTQKTFGQNLELMDLTIVPEKMDVLYRGNPLSLLRAPNMQFSSYSTGIRIRC